MSHQTTGPQAPSSAASIPAQETGPIAVKSVCEADLSHPGIGEYTLAPEQIEPHEFALLPPETPDDQFGDLVASREKNGQLVSVTMLNGKVLDGRGRVAACKKLRIMVRCRPLAPGIDPLSYVVAQAACRRQLSAGQRAAFAAKLVPIYSEEAAKRKRALSGTRANADGSQPEVPEFVPEPDGCGEAREKAAKLTGSNPKYVSNLLKIQREAPELFKEVERAAMSIPKALRELEKQCGEDQGSSRRDAFTVVLWDDEAAPPTRAPEKSYSAKTYPNLAFFRFHNLGDTKIESASKHGLAQVAIFAVPVEESAIIKDNEGKSFCKATCRLLTLSIRGAVPEPATVPGQMIEGGHAGVVRMIESMFPDSLKALSSATREAPPGWQYIPRGMKVANDLGQPSQPKTIDIASESVQAEEPIGTARAANALNAVGETKGDVPNGSRPISEGSIAAAYAATPEVSVDLTCSAYICAVIASPPVAELPLKPSSDASTLSEKPRSPREPKSTSVKDHLVRIRFEVRLIAKDLRRRWPRTSESNRLKAIDALDLCKKELVAIIASVGRAEGDDHDGLASVGGLPFHLPIRAGGLPSNPFWRVTKTVFAIARFLHPRSPQMARALTKIGADMNRIPSFGEEGTVPSGQS